VPDKTIESMRRLGDELARDTARLADPRGAPDRSSPTAFYEAHRELASRRTFEQLRDMLGPEPAEPQRAGHVGRDRRRSIELFMELVGTNLERRATAPVTEAWQETAARLAADVAGADGRAVPFAAIPFEIEQSPDRGRRAALERALNDGRATLAPLAVEALGRARDAAAAAGGEDYVRWRSMLGRYDLDALAATATQLLDATDDMARESLPWLLRGRVDVPPREIAPHDLARASRAADLDALLGPDELWRIDDLFARLGLDPKAGGRLVRDLAPEARARPACAVVEIPDEIHLVAGPLRGLPGWRALLHELGRGLFLTGIDRRRPFEHRWLGDQSVAEGYATLLDHLLLDPVWARRVLKLPPDKADRLARVAASIALLGLRRTAARLLHEIACARDREPGEVDGLYLDLMSRATGVPHAPTGRMAEVAPEFVPARALRAGLFEGLAHTRLRDRFDEDWFVNPRAGDWLRGLFSGGHGRDLHEIAAEELGVDLAAADAVSRFEELL
jgi:hypothetical protein